MARSDALRRTTRWFLLLGFCVSALLVLTPLPPVHAQASSRNKTILRNDGVTLALGKTYDNVSASHSPKLQADASTTQRHKSATTGAANHKSVIGKDGRKPLGNTDVFPNSAIAQLDLEFPGQELGCTAWFIGSHRLATAAHCLYEPAYGGFAEAVLVAPGRDEDTNPFGEYTPVNWFVPTGWVNTHDPKFDYGVVVLDSNVGDTVGWFGYKVVSDDSLLQDRLVHVRGYPTDRVWGTLWTIKGPIERVDKTRLWYSIDTSGGQGGSPVFGKYSAKCDPCSFAIHIRGVSVAESPNSAARITPKVFKFLKNAGVSQQDR